MTKKRVFITGATGNMGGAALKELLGRRDRFDIVLLARPGKKNIKKLKYLKDEPGVEIIWGDLTDYDSVLNGVTGADYVLHIGGMVSPAADMYPERTLKVNVQGARNVVGMTSESCTSAPWLRSATICLQDTGDGQETRYTPAYSTGTQCQNALQN